MMRWTTRITQHGLVAYGTAATCAGFSLSSLATIGDLISIGMLQKDGLVVAVHIAKRINME